MGSGNLDFPGSKGVHKVRHTRGSRPAQSYDDEVTE